MGRRFGARGGNVSADRRVGETCRRFGVSACRRGVFAPKSFNRSRYRSSVQRSMFRSYSCSCSFFRSASALNWRDNDRRTPSESLRVYLRFPREFFQNIPPQKPIAQHLGGYSHRLELTGIT
jgi:hypothetical protein